MKTIKRPATIGNYNARKPVEKIRKRIGPKVAPETVAELARLSKVLQMSQARILDTAVARLSTEYPS